MCRVTKSMGKVALLPVAGFGLARIRADVSSNQGHLANAALFPAYTGDGIRNRRSQSYQALRARELCPRCSCFSFPFPGSQNLSIGHDLP